MQDFQLFWIRTHIYYFIVLLKSRGADDSVRLWLGRRTLIYDWPYAVQCFTPLHKYASNDFIEPWDLCSKILFDVPHVLSATWIINMSLGYISFVTFPSVHIFCQAFWSSACANASALLNGPSKEKRWLSISFWFRKSHKTALSVCRICFVSANTEQIRDHQ